MAEETKPRGIEQIDRELALARAAYADEGPKHYLVEACERLYAERQAWIKANG